MLGPVHARLRTQIDHYGGLKLWLYRRECDRSVKLTVPVGRLLRNERRVPRQSPCESLCRHLGPGPGAPNCAQRCGKSARELTDPRISPTAPGGGAGLSAEAEGCGWSSGFCTVQSSGRVGFSVGESWITRRRPDLTGIFAWTGAVTPASSCERPWLLVLECVRLHTAEAGSTVTPRSV
jgi:hypothetical protein